MLLDTGVYTASFTFPVIGHKNSAGGAEATSGAEADAVVAGGGSTSNGGSRACVGEEVDVASAGGGLIVSTDVGGGAAEGCLIGTTGKSFAPPARGGGGRGGSCTGGGATGFSPNGSHPSVGL